jgi:cytochrome c peroxidase
VTPLRPILCAALALAGPLAAQALGSPPAPFENPVTAEKALLGKILFWEEQLSSDGSMACGTCHRPAAGGTDPRRGRHPGIDGILGNADDSLGSPGIVRADARGDHQPDPLFGLGHQVTRRTAPPVIGAAYLPALRWDGQAIETYVDPQTSQTLIMFGGALENHALGPPTDPREMADAGRNWNQVAAKIRDARPLALASDLPPDLATALAQDPDYGELMRRAFGDRAVTATRIVFALATYQRTLVPDRSPWDAFQRGVPNALSPAEQAGLAVFEGPGRCATCHPAPLFSDGSFRNLGLRPVGEDLGWQLATQDPIDRGKFKVPSLRNVGLRDRFMHHGALPSLEAVVDFYDQGGGPFADNKDRGLRPLNLAPQQKQDLVAFLRGALTDPRVAAAQPPFDRPQLASERAPAPFGRDHPGAGGLAPRSLAASPLQVGAPDLRVGLADARGGALAAILFSTARGPAGLSLGPVPIHLALDPPVLVDAVPLGGQGPGQGHGTVHLRLPADPSLAGVPLFHQWFVADPAAAGGLAASPGHGGPLWRRP